MVDEPTDADGDNVSETMSEVDDRITDETSDTAEEFDGVDLDDVMNDIAGGEHYKNIMSGGEASYDGESPPGSDEWPIVWRMHKTLSTHGHLHVTVDCEPHDVEMSIGNTMFNYNHGIIEVWTNDGDRVVRMDRIVSWYEPNDFYDN